MKKKYILQHNVRFTSTPTRNGKEFFRRDGLYGGGVSKAKKFTTAQQALNFANSLGITDVTAVEI